jgi:hypothetical protein
MEYNGEAFHIAQRSTVASSFLEARATLTDIQIERITDPDVLEYVQYCKDLANFCIDYGISREGVPTFWNVLTGTDYRKAAEKTIWDSIKDLSIISGPAKMFLGGLWIKFKLSGWFELQEKLMKRYHSDVF